MTFAHWHDSLTCFQNRPPSDTSRAPAPDAHYDTNPSCAVRAVACSLALTLAAPPRADVVTSTLMLIAPLVRRAVSFSTRLAGLSAKGLSTAPTPLHTLTATPILPKPMFSVGRVRVSFGALRSPLMTLLLPSRTFSATLPKSIACTVTVCSRQRCALTRTPSRSLIKKLSKTCSSLVPHDFTWIFLT